MEIQEEESDEQKRCVEICKAVRKELGGLPEHIRDQFIVALERLKLGLDPTGPGIRVAPLQASGKGVMELKINGRPAYRLVYTLKIPGKVVVLAARPKTCQGQDKTLIRAASSRLKRYT